MGRTVKGQCPGPLALKRLKSFPCGHRQLWFALPTNWDGAAAPTFAREPHGVITRLTYRDFSSPFAKNKNFDLP